jgi:TPR repeat protein
MDVPGAFASNNKTIIESENGRKMQSTMRSYMKVASLVDREVMTWDKLPPEQQTEMNDVIKNLNLLADNSVAGEIATEAQFVLGVIYEHGRGMPQPKFDRAAELYQTSAEGGCTEALYNLGGLTREGVEGVKKDLPLAFAIYETAAHQEHVS